jgi:hypothetical protein
VRSLEAEIENILAGLDKQYEMLFIKTTITGSGFARLVFIQIHEAASQGVRIEKTVEDICTGLDGLPLPKQYYRHFIKVCAHCVSSILHLQYGKEVEAWQQALDAKAQAGSALSLYVTASEGSRKRRKQGKAGGDRLAQRNQKIKDFVLEQYGLGVIEKPTPAGKKISYRFTKPYGDPELKLSDYNAGHLSLDRLEKTFAEWISDEIDPKTDGCQANG